MRRRLLVSYLALTVVILLLLEVPLGVVEARQEHDALAATARRDATALSVLAAEELGGPGRHDLAALASRYRAQAGSEVAIMDASGRILVALDPDERNHGSAELAPVMRRALGGESRTTRRQDEGSPQLVAVLPVRSSSRVVGAVAVAVPASSTDNRIRRAWLALALVAVLLAGVGSGLGLVLARSLTSPLTRLQGAAGRLGEGVLSARAPPGGPREIAALAEEFNRMADQLSGMVQGQQRFVADASHQLRTPLTSLRLRLENLMAAAGTQDLADDIANCQAEVDRLARLVDGLLAFSRAEGRRTSGSTVDTVAVAVERAQAWSALAEERNVSVRVEGPGEAGEVGAAIEPDDLEQVLDNLLANAVEASPPGATITVTIERTPGSIERTPGSIERPRGPTDRVAGRVVLHVRDEGPGMSAADRARAFDRFWQGPNGATGSSGLGLPIVQELVRAASGTVTLGSTPGGGLDVVVSLPSTAPGVSL